MVTGNDGKNYLTTREAAELLGYTSDYITMLARRGKIPAIRDGKNWLVLEEGLGTYIGVAKVEEERRREALRQERLVEYKKSPYADATQYAFTAAKVLAAVIGVSVFFGGIALGAYMAPAAGVLARIQHAGTTFALRTAHVDAETLNNLTARTQNIFALDDLVKDFGTSSLPRQDVAVAHTAVGEPSVATSAENFDGAFMRARNAVVAFVRNLPAKLDTQLAAVSVVLSGDTTGEVKTTTNATLGGFTWQNFLARIGSLFTTPTPTVVVTTATSTTHIVERVSSPTTVVRNVSNYVTTTGITRAELDAAIAASEARVRASIPTFSGSPSTTVVNTQTFAYSQRIDVLDGVTIRNATIIGGSISGTSGIGSGSGSGTVNGGVAGQIAYYAGAGSEVSATSTLFIASNQFVGVGTSSPLAQFTVYGDTFLSGANRYVNFGDDVGAAGYGIRDNGGILEFKNQAGTWLGLGTGGGGGTDGNWAFFNNSGIRLSTTTNQVLIGGVSTTTLAKLQVIGGAVFDSATSTNATSTNQYVSGQLTVASLSGFLKATAGKVAASAINFATDITGLTITTPVFGQLLSYNGSAWVNIATSTLGINFADLVGSATDAQVADNLTISGGTINNSPIGATTPSTGVFTNSTSTNATTTNGYISGQLRVASLSGLLYGTSGNVSAVTNGTSGQILGIVGGVPTWVATTTAGTGLTYSGGAFNVAGLTTAQFASANVSQWTNDAGYITSAAVSPYPFSVTGNATSTLTQFNGGLTAFASTTIGNGLQAGGLTISGGATTTGTAYFGSKVGIGALNPKYALSIENGSAPGGSFPTNSYGFVLSGTGYANGNNRFGSVEGNAVTYFLTRNDGLAPTGELSTYDYANGVGLPLFLNANGGNISIGSATLAQSTLDVFGNLSLGSYAGNNAAPSNGLIVSGNTGIGTSSPYAKLSIGGDVVVGAPTAGGTLGNLYLPTLANPAGTLLATDASGKVIATSTPSFSGLTSYDAFTHPAVGQSATSSTLITTGGLVVNAASSTIAGNLTITGNATTTNATTTNQYVSGQLTVGSLSGFLKATAGKIATAAINLTSDITGTLPVGNGGTGQTTFSASQLIYGNGTANLSSVATTTFTPSAEFTTTGTIGALVGGVNSTLSLATNGVALTKIAQIAGNTILGNNTGVAGNVVAFATSSLGINFADLVGSATDAQVTNALTISGGTIDNSPIGATTPSTGVFTNATTTNATTTTFYISGAIRGAGLTSCSGSSDKLIWNATTGQFGCGADAGAGGGITSLGAQYSSFQTGSSQTFATSSDTNLGLTITSAGNIHTFTPTWIGTLSVTRGGTGLSSVADGSLLFGSGGTTLTALASSTGGFLSNSYTTGRPTWLATSTLNINFSNLIGTATDAQVADNLTISGGTIDNTPIGANTPSTGVFTNSTSTNATTTNLKVSGELTVASLSGFLKATAGKIATAAINLTSDITGTLPVGNGGTGQTSFTAGQLIYGNGGANLSSVATSSISVGSSLSVTGGSLGYQVGGSNVTINTAQDIRTSAAPTFSNLTLSGLTTNAVVYTTNSGALASTATSSVSCTGSVSCGSTSYVLGSALTITGTGLASYDAWTHPAAGQSATSSVLITTGGLVVNAASSTIAGNLTVTGNATSTNATSTNQYVSGQLTVASLSGFLKATAGKVAASAINFATDITGLTITTPVFGQLLSYNGSAWVNIATSTLGINFADLVGSATDAQVADNLTISGGTIDNSPIGATTPSTGVFTNSTSTNATTTNLAVSGTATTSNLVVSNTFKLGSLTGFLKATAGVISTAAINLTSDVTGILPTANGGTGWAALQANTLLLGNGSGAVATTSQGTNGQVLALVAGVPSWVSTSSINNGVASIQQTYGSAQTGALTFATSTDTNIVLNVTNSGSAFTFAPSWTGTLAAGRGGTGISNPTAAGILLGSYAGGSYQQLATSSLGINFTSLVGSATDAQVADNLTISGGTIDNSPIGATTPSTGVFTNATSTNATTTNLKVSGELTVASLSGFLKATAGKIATAAINLASDVTGILPVTNGGTGQSSFGQGWLGINDSGAFISSTSPTVNYITATSTTATSTFSTAGVAIAGSRFVVQQGSGNVGIGTNNPSGKLNVVDPVGSAATGDNIFRIETTGGTVGPSLRVKSAEGADYIITSTGSGNTGGAGAFRIMDLSTSANRLWIAGTTGNIGLGNSTPQSRLDVSGGLSVGSYAGTNAAPSNGLIVSGNAGIGTSSPYAKFAVGGDVVVGAATAGGTLGNVYIPTLANAAGTFIAADPTGKLIATATPTFNGLTSYDAWTHPAVGQSATSSTLITTGGLVVNAASSTIAGNLTITGNATTTNATSTNEYVSGQLTIASLTGFLKAAAGKVSTSAINFATDIAGVTITSPVFGQLLSYNGSAWVNTATSTLGINFADLVGSATDAQVTNALTISGGTIDNSPIGATTPSTGVFTNATSTNATTTNLYISGAIRGAGLTSCSGSSDKLIWNATTGQFGCGADAGAGGGITSLGAQYSSFQSGSSQTFATSSDTNLGLTITSAGNIHTFTPTWIGTLSVTRGGTGLSSVADGSLLFGSGGTTLTALASSTGGFLSNSYTTGRPTWLATSTLNINFSNLIGSATDAQVADNLTISGGTIDNSPIGATTPSTGVFTNSTSTNATTTNLKVSGELTVASLSGFLKATAGVVSTAAINLTSDITGTLPVGNGGTGQTSFTAGQLIYGNGGANLSSVATTTFTPSGEFTTTGTIGAFVGGANSTLSLATNGVALTKIAQIGANTLLGNATGATGNITTISTSSLGINFTSLVGSATDAQVADNLTISGGTIDNTPIGANTPSTGVFTNSTSTNATTTNLKVSGELTVASLSGFLKATAGKIATAAINLASDVTGILPTANGGTGWGSLQANTILLGNGTGAVATTSQGTNGQVLALVAGVPSWVATSSINNGVSSLAGTANQITASASTGAVTLTLPNHVIFPNSFNATLSSTTNATTTGSFYLTALAKGALAIGDSGIVYSAATTTAGTGLTYSGNAFNVNTTQNIAKLSNLTSNGFVKTSGGDGTLSIDTNTYLTAAGAVTSVQQTYGSAQTGALTLATSSATTFNGLSLTNGITNSSGTFTFAPDTITGTLNVAGGGTGLSSVADGRLVIGGTSATALSSLATSTGGTILQTSFTTGRPSWVATSTLGINFADLTGTASDAQVADNLTISGGTINNTTIGAVTPSTIVSTNSTTTNATSTNEYISGELTLGSLTGFLKATAGKISTGLVDLAANVTGILPVPNGGTGWAALQANTLLLGNGSGKVATTSAGTNGQILSLVSGVPSWVATTTFSSGLAYSAGNVTNTGVLSFQQSSGSAQTGAITVATSSDTNLLLNVTNTAGTFTFAPAWAGTLADARVADNLTISGGTIDNTPIGAATPSTGVFTNATSTNATSTTGYVSGEFRVGATPFLKVSSLGFGTTTLSGLNINGSATTTSNVGFNITSGCFAIGGTCLSNTSGTVTSVDVSGGTTGLTTSGGPVTNSGTITLAGLLNVANGGTGWAAIQAGAIPYGNGSSRLATTSAGTAGQILALLNGVPTWTATTTLATISGTLSGTQLDGVFSGNGVLVRTGAGTYTNRTITGTANQITVTNGDGVAGNPTLSLPTSLIYTNASTTNITSSYASTSVLVASNSFTLGSLTGFLKATAGVVSTAAINLTSDITGTLPVGNGGTGQTSFTAGQLIYGNGGANLSSVATTTFTPSGEFTTTGTIGAFVGGANSTLSLATNGVALTKIAQIAGNTILGNNTGAVGNVVAFATSTLGINFANLVGSATDAQVADNLTISGGTIDNTPIGASSASTGVFTNSTSTNATSTNQAVTGELTIGSLSGFLKATAGKVATAAINLASDVSGILPTANGGTGWAALQANTLLLGNGSGAVATTSQGTNGQVLALVAGVPSWVSTSSINNGVSSIQQTFGSAQTGALTFATSTDTNIVLNVTNSGGAFTFAPSWTGTLAAGRGGTGIANPTAAGILLGSYAGGSYQQLATSSLGINFTSLVGSATDAQVADNLTISGGTIDNTPIGANTPSTGVFTNSTSTNATTTNLKVSGELTVGSLSGFLKAVAGKVTTGLVDLTANVTGVLPIANGGTNTNSQTTNGVAYFDGTKITTGTGLTFDGATLSVSGFINTDQYSGFKQAGNTVLYASTTNNTLAVGSSAAAAWMSASSTLGNSIAIGKGALASTPTNPTAGYNVAVGSDSLSHITLGANNVAVGANALFSNTTGYENFGLGASALYNNTTGSYNVGIGANSLIANTSGDANIAVGRLAMQYNTVGQNNISLGYASLNVSTSTNNNTAIGHFAGAAISGATGVAGGFNTLIGSLAGSNITTGGYNTVIGSFTGSSITTGSNNILIGQDVRSGLTTTASNQLNLGNLLFGTGIASGNTLSTGAIGIGTSSPYARLSIGGDVVVGASTAGGTLGDLYLPTLANPAGTLLATDASGKVIATSTPSFNGLVTYDAFTHPAAGQSATSSVLITTGGLVVNAASSTIAGNLTITGNATSTNATSTNQYVSGQLTVASLSGFLKATAGKIATAAINLASDVTGILPTANGGTGWGSLQANTILLGNGSGSVATTSQGTNGQILSLVSGVPSWVATTTFSSGLAYSAGNVTNTGVLSFQQSSGSAQTGAITIATSSDTNLLLNVTNTAGTFTFAPAWAGTLADARVADNLTISGGTIDNSPIGASTPSTGVFTNSTSTNATTTNLKVSGELTVASLSGFLKATAGKVATAAINLASDITGTLPVGNGGTGQTSFTAGQLIYGNGNANLSSVATSSISVGTSLAVTGGSLGYQVGGSNVTINTAQDIRTSAAPTFSNLTLSGLTTNAVVYTTNSGALASTATSSVSCTGSVSCGSTSYVLGGALTITGTGLASYDAFTHPTAFGTTTSATSTALFARMGLFASSTSQFANASTTLATITSGLYNTYLTSGRVPFTTTNGLLTDSSKLSYDDTNGTLAISSSGAQPTINNAADGVGVILRGISSGTTGQLRIVPNSGAWTDAAATTYFQITNSVNNNASFMGGTYGADSTLNRLQFNASSTQVTDLAFGSTPVPNSVFAIVNSTAAKTAFTIRAASSQVADILNINSNAGASGDLFRIEANGKVTFANASTTNITSSYASTSALVASNSFTLGSLSGFLKATAGVVSTAAINLTSDITGTLPVGNGGTGQTSFTAGQLIYGNGNANLSSVATSSITAGSEFSYSGTLGALVGGANGTLTLATNGIAYSKLAQAGANTLLGNPTGTAGNIQAISTSTLGINFSTLVGTASDAQVADNLTVSGGTIDNTPIGASTPSTGVFTNATSTNATSTTAYVSGEFRVGTTPFLKVSNLGFGTTTLSGLNINGSATTTSNVGFNITSGCFAVGGTCIGSGASGVTSVQQSFGSAQTGALTIATTSDTNILLNVTNSGGTFTFAPSFTGTLADSRVADNLTISGGTIDNTPIGASTPSTGVFTNATSTNATTTNLKVSGELTVASLSGFLKATAGKIATAAINLTSDITGTLPVGNGGTGQTSFTASQLIYGNGTAGFSSVATTSFTPSGEFSTTGTIGAFVGGANSTLSLATNGVALTKLAQIAGNTILGNNTGATGNVVAFATSTLGIAISDTTGTLTATRGGTGQSTVAVGDTLYGSGVNTWSKLAAGTGGQVLAMVGGIPGWVATTTLATISGTLSGTQLDGVFGTNGILTRTTTGTYASRTITGTASQITVTNGDGVAGNPTLSLPTSLIYTNASTTNITSSYASTSVLVASNSFTLGSLTGFLKATAGVVSTAAINLTSDITGTLPVGNGGTGQTSFTAGQLIYGNGGANLSSVATSSISVGSSLSVTGGSLGYQVGGSNVTVALNLTNANTWTGQQIFQTTGTGSTFGSNIDAIFNAQASGREANIKIGDGTNQSSVLSYMNGNTTPRLGIGFATAGEILSVSSAGSVGIGTTTPQWRLTIASSTGPQLALTDASLTSNPWTFRSVNGNFYLATSSPTTFATSTVTGLEIDTNGAVSVSNALRVGRTITNGTPIAKLEVYDSSNLSSTAFSTTTLLRLNVPTTNSDNLYASLSRLSSGSDWTTAAWRLQRRVDSTDMGYIQFGNQTTSLLTFGKAGTEYMRIDGNGNLNIGTTSAWTKLTVGDGTGSQVLTLDGAAASNKGIVFRDAGTQVGQILSVSSNAYFDHPGSLFIRDTSGATIQATFASGGNVGIGTTTPQWKLTASSATTPQLALTDTSLTSDIWTQRAINGNFYLATSSASTFATSTVAAMSFDTNGVPTFGQLAGSGTNCVQVTAAGALQRTGSACGSGGGTNTDKFATSTDGFSIYPNGLVNPIVGIGTTTAKFTLSVASSTRAQLSLADGSLTSNQWAFRSINSYLFFATSSPSTFATSTLSAFTIDPNGFVGIATSTPWTNFAVNGTAAADRFVAVSTTATSTFAGSVNVNSGALTYDITANKTSIERLDLGPLSFDTNAGVVSWIDVPVTNAATVGTKESYSAMIDGVSLMTIYGESDGAGGTQKTGVGIGTTTPSARLAITQRSNDQWGGLWLAASDDTDYRALSMSTAGVLTFQGGDTGGTLNSATLSAAGAWTNAPSFSFLKTNREVISKDLLLDILATTTLETYKLKSDIQTMGTTTADTQLGIVLDYAHPLLVDHDAEGHIIGYNPERTAAAALRGVQIFTNIIDISDATTSVPTMKIDALGNIAIASSTNPNYRLNVGGDVSATGFVNVSTRDEKTNISYINASSSASIFDTVMNSIKVATYNYLSDSTSTAPRLGLIAEEAPDQVLSTDKKGIDLYKLVSFTLLGLQGLGGEVRGSVEDRLTALEQKVASSTGAVMNGIATFASVITDKLTIGSSAKPSGITLYDEDTGEPYCVKVKSGALVNIPGECGTATSTPSGTGTTTDTEAPIITIFGNNPATVNLNDAYADLGASVTDNVDQNLGIQTFVDDATTTVTTVQIDTSVAGTHTILYKATDVAGNVGSATRTVIVGTSTPPTP